jgi:taurine dioxygenase
MSVAAAIQQENELEIIPLSPIGAEVRGIRLSEPISDSTRARLRKAFTDHSVLAFRDQWLDAPQVMEAALIFGEIFPQHNAKFSVPEYPLVHYISNADTLENGKRYIPGEGYHTDHSNAAAPPMATVLSAVKIPSVGGDTQFVDMVRAYQDLPAEIKERILGRRAIHIYQSSHSARQLPQLSEGRRASVPEAVLQPLVLRHPNSGHLALYINPIRIEGILGMDDKEALPLLDQLLEHATQEQYQYRHVWKGGDFVIWDNRGLMHKANGDYDMNEERYLYRLMLKGVPLVGANG